MDKRVGYAVGWVIAALVAIAVGVATVTAVGATMTGRGPLGDEVVRDADTAATTQSPSPSPSVPSPSAPSPSAPTPSAPTPSAPTPSAPTPSVPTPSAPTPSGKPAPPGQDDLVTRVIEDEFGAFVVGCRGVYAVGLEARPDRDAGWRVVSFERGPDDDVDAEFRQPGRSAEVEVFCNRGVPTVAEIEYEPDSDD